ncbi:hypothetical protein OG302_22370 [Streptomyces sp. NBC_01283]|uniref:hypothetical protein n=1 Tax=Streptomyces sp. NBC_01283 TaxID=2903812 RepID=UPI00352FA75C|nr:hypothetical protein OG302_22370 [Streptomyces sp. NBC_01283]
MRARAVAAGHRLCLGTGKAFEWLGYWLGGKSHTPERHTLPADLAWLGVVLRRLVLLALAAIFYAGLLIQAPHLIYLAPIAWAVMAWQMSDWSATPPPRGVAPESDEAARRRLKRARGALDPNGVMCIYHAPREEINEPDSHAT